MEPLVQFPGAQTSRLRLLPDALRFKAQARTPALPGLQLAHHILPEAVDFPSAPERHQVDVAALARLEAHRRARRNVEPLASRLGPVEFQGRIGLEEMIVA